MKKLFLGLAALCISLALPTQAYAEQATVAVTLALHGISTTGDAINPGNQGTVPRHTVREIHLTFSDTNNKPQSEQTTTVSFDPATNLFAGSLTLADIKPGDYVIRVAVGGFLPRSWATIKIAANKTTTLDTMTLINGDINEDKAITVKDYNILLNCFGEKQYTEACIYAPVSNRVGADITDDGVVDGLDYNLFLREFSTQTSQ